MDLADDIAYAVHDLEDFAGAGVIDLREPLVDLTSAINAYDTTGKFDESPSADSFSTAATDLQEDGSKHGYDAKAYRDAMVWAVKLIQDDFPTFIGAPTPEHFISLREQLSELIGMFFGAISIASERENPASPLVFLKPLEWHRLQVLKVITKRYLVLSPRMGIIQRAQKRIVSDLFRGLVRWLEEGPKPSMIPPELKDYIELGGETVPVKVGPVRTTLSATHYRAVSDYICGLSDAEALRRAQWIVGAEVPGMTALNLA